MQRQRMVCRLLIYGLLMLLLAKPAVAQEVFTYQDLGSLNIDLTLGRYLNDAGQVSAAGQTEVYNGYDYDEVFHACISDWIDLTPGVDGDTAASQINNYGQVLVTDDWGYGGSYHLLWTPSTPNGGTGTFTDLGNVNAEDLNDYGEVVGEDSSGNAFLWKPSAPNATTGTFIHLGKGSAYSINTLGQVSCSFGLFTPSQANGATGAITAAPAGLLNDYGQILTGNQLWTPSTANGASGSAIALPFTGQALNKYGQIVGYDNQSNALLWIPAVRNGATGTVLDLAYQLYFLYGISFVYEVDDINNYGQVLVDAETIDVPTDPVLLTPSLSLANLTAGPNPIAGSLTASGRVRLNIPPPYDAVVQLKSNNAAANVPSMVTIPYGAYHLNFPIHTVAVTSPVTATLQATFGGVTKSVSLTVRPISVKNVTLTPFQVTGGSNVAGKVTLEAPAAPGNITVTLSSSNTTVAHPTVSRITIPAGASTGTFTVATGHVSSATVVTIKATANGLSKTKNLTVNP